VEKSSGEVEYWIHGEEIYKLHLEDFRWNLFKVGLAVNHRTLKFS
jgi:hypothetical protein